MQGVVTDATTGRPLYPVTVVNTTTQKATTTDEKGLYTIMANTGDVVAFSYIGYKSVEKPKPTSVLIATANIAMEVADYQLKEFMLRPGNLTKYQIDSAERRATYRRELVRDHPSPFASPVSALAEQFSRKAKRVYQFQKDFQERELNRFIDTRYTPELVTTLTHLTGDSIGYFMYAYPMPYDFARTASDLELKMWIRDSYKSWTKTIAKDSVAAKK